MSDPESPINWDSPYPFKVIRSHWPEHPEERLADGVHVAYVQTSVDWSPRVAGPTYGAPPSPDLLFTEHPESGDV